MSVKRSVEVMLDRLGLLGPAFAARQFSWRLRPSTIIHNAHRAIVGAPDGLPVPKTSARVRVAGSPDADWFLESGRRAAESIKLALNAQGCEVGEAQRILDFGCGCGRVLRYWSGIDSVQLYGTDFQHSLLRECRKVIPAAHLVINGPEPPLPFASASFDLVYCLSVFTHFDERQERRWRNEILRVLKPGGWWVFSVQGDAYLSKLSDHERQAYEAGHVVCQRAGFRGLNLCMTFHPETYVRKNLSEGFAVADFRPQGAKGNPPQDLYVFQRLPVAVDTPTAHRIGDANVVH